MFNKIKAIKDLRDKAKHMQSALAEVHCEGSACWGKVTVKIDGNQQIEEVHIDPEMLKDADKLASAIKDAANDAIKKLQKELAHKMKDLGGMEMFKDLGIGA